MSYIIRYHQIEGSTSLHTVHTVQTALHCFKCSMHAQLPTYILLEKVKTLLEEWANQLLSKMLDGLEWILVKEKAS